MIGMVRFVKANDDAVVLVSPEHVEALEDITEWEEMPRTRIVMGGANFEVGENIEDVMGKFGMLLASDIEAAKEHAISHLAPETAQARRM